MCMLLYQSVYMYVCKQAEACTAMQGHRYIRVYVYIHVLMP
jgi:hypothetical protein